MLIKEYFVTFCIAFFMTVFACFFNYFQSLAVSALGGLPLAAVAYWRMAVVGKAGLSITGHTVAFMLGWLLIFAAIIFPMLKSTLGSLMIYCSWGLAALLACIVYRFRRRIIAPDGMSYSEMNDMTASVPIGSDGVTVIPFGNGAERVLENKETGCSINGLNFNKHGKAHIMRAAQEGIVFSFCYGMEVMQQMGMDIRKIHAGRANMFLSDVFRKTLAGVSGATIELYETDGSVGAAKGAGMGCGIYKNHDEAFSTLKKLSVIEPDEAQRPEYLEAYSLWKENLQRIVRK